MTLIIHSFITLSLHVYNIKITLYSKETHSGKLHDKARPYVKKYFIKINKSKKYLMFVIYLVNYNNCRYLY